jgi:hypothetical protein
MAYLEQKTRRSRVETRQMKTGIVILASMALSATILILAGILG